MVRALESPAISSTDHTTFMVGLAGRFTFTTVMRSFPSSFSASGRLPSCVTFRSMGNNTAILEGTPDLGTVGRYLIRVTAFDGEGQGVCQEFILAIHRTMPPRAVAGGPHMRSSEIGEGQVRDQGADFSEPIIARNTATAARTSALHRRGNEAKSASLTR